MVLRTIAIALVTFCFPGAGLCQNAETGINSSLEHAVFFSGRVTLEDGSPPPGPVLIQRVCNGLTRTEATTDSRGRFSFKVDAGDSPSKAGDASQAAAPPPDVAKPMGISSQYSHPITSALRDCEVHAVLAGFRAENVSIALKSTLDNPRLPPMVLHPIARAVALTVSATTLAAPPGARKAYEKGLVAMGSQKWEPAAREFGTAVKLYPAFAIAWYELGAAEQKRDNLPAARDAWKAAILADPKYEKPYESLTFAADARGEWAEAEKYSRAWIELDAEDFPVAYLFSAIANARLNRPAEAERAAREGLRLDKEGKVARLRYVLGLLLMQKGESGEAAKCFRSYLAMAPNAHDAPLVRQEVERLEAAAAGAPQ